MGRRTSDGAFEALNFTPKAIADLAKLAENPSVEKSDADGIRFVMQILQRAQVFVLPDAGELLDRSKPRPQVPGLMYRPPFPAVALEYRAVERGTAHPLYEAVQCTRRISLAWEWDGIMPGGAREMSKPAPGEGLVIASISYLPDLGTWVPIACATMIPYECTYEKAELGPHQAAFIESGRISRKQAEAPGLRPWGMLPLMPEAMRRTASEYGFQQSISMITADLMDEVNAYCDLCIALACNNVTTERHEAPHRLNKSRIKAGKPPLKNFHILKVDGAGEGHALGGHSGPGGIRSHLRRGHIRRLGGDRVTWVNACIVRGSRPGFLKKQYAPSAHERIA